MKKNVKPTDTKELASKKIGQNVLHVLQGLGWSRKDLAGMVGSTPSQIGSLVKGHIHNLAWFDLYRICLCFGITVDDLINAKLNIDEIKRYVEAKRPAPREVLVDREAHGE